jgi:hypothetical protein
MTLSFEEGMSKLGAFNVLVGVLSCRWGCLL